MKYYIEASTNNPETRHGYERGNIMDYEYTNSARIAWNWITTFWNRGYWVEVYNDDTKELLAGPFNPDETLPRNFFG